MRECTCGSEYRTWTAVQYCYLNDHDFANGPVAD